MNHMHAVERINSFTTKKQKMHKSKKQYLLYWFLELLEVSILSSVHRTRLSASSVVKPPNDN